MSDSPNEVSEEALEAAEGNEVYVDPLAELPPILRVHSRVRHVETRTKRAKAPTRHRFKQYLFSDPSKRLVRRRPLHIKLEELRLNLDELVAKEAAGILSVHLLDGRRLNLVALQSALSASSGQPVTAPIVESAPATPPLPNPPLDSAANDTPAGEAMPRFIDGTFHGDPAAARAIDELVAEKVAETGGLPAAPDPAAADAEEPAAPAEEQEPADPAADRARSSESDHRKHKKGKK